MALNYFNYFLSNNFFLISFLILLMIDFTDWFAFWQRFLNSHYNMHFPRIIFVFLFINNSTDKILSVKNLCEKNGKIRPNFAEIFGQKWDNERLECENENETDQNPTYYQSDQNRLNSAESIRNDQQNNQLDDQKKCEIVRKFHAIREGIKKRGKYSTKVWNKMDQKIAEKLGISMRKIYKWKKELKLNKKKIYEKKKQEFVERIDEFKRMTKNRKQKQFMKELGISKETLTKWKREFGIEIGKMYLNEEKTDKINIYYKMKNDTPSLTDKEIADLLKISLTSLIRWKKNKLVRWVSSFIICLLLLLCNDFGSLLYLSFSNFFLDHYLKNDCLQYLF